MNKLLNKMFQQKRLEFDKLTQQLYDTHTFPIDVLESRNIHFGADNSPAHRMDVYRPANIIGR